MKKNISSKKGLFTALTIILVVILAGFISIRSGALKFNLTVSKNSQATDFKLPSSAITPPQSWQQSAPDAKKGQLAHFESLEIDSEKDSSGGTVTTNAVIDVKVSGDYQDLDGFVSQYRASGAKVKNYRVIDSSSLENNGYRLEITYQTAIGEGTITVHELDYLFFKDGASFLIKGYSADSAWNKHVNEIKTSLDSFRFK